MTDSSCVVRYGETPYHVALTAVEVHYYVVDKLNESAHRRGDAGLRKHIDASTPDLRPIEGGGGHEGQYDPFLIIPLRDGGSVALHVHDGMALTIHDHAGELADTTLDRLP